MNAKTLRPALLSFLAVVPSVLGNGVVINEIMYEPASENAAEEYIEFHNSAGTNVNLGGWQLDSGVSFVFPAGTQLAPGAYLVVAADTNAFLAKYPGVNNVLGNWGGTLANRGERVRLSDAAGNTISSVTYADGGDWGVRMRGAGETRPLEVWVNGRTATFKLFGNFRSGDVVEISGAEQPEYNGVFTISGASSSGFNVTLPFAPAEMPTGILVVRQLTDYTRTGWAWSSRAKGLGSSLELVTAALPGEYGQNWKASAVAHGTPGQPNSVALTNAAPLILGAAHFPAVPSTNQTITITARLLDEQAAGATAALRWRLDAVSPLAFSLAPMFDDGLHGDGTAGDGLFGALIPAQTNNAIVEFYIEARDAQNNLRTWPAPALSETNTYVQAANALLQVDSSTYTGTAPLYKLIMRESERAELHSFPADSTWRQSDAAMNLTFIAIDGTGTSIRYTGSARNRGAGSRSANPMNYRVSLPSDNPWQGTDGFNVNSRYPQAQVAGYALGNLAGLNSESARAVQVRVNNRNLASTGSSGYGHYTHSEPVGADYARRHFPNDPDGNVYRASSGNHTAGLSYIGTNIYSYTSAGYSKNSNSGENDWTDLMELCRVLSDAPDADYADAVRQVVNVDQWMHYFAVFTLLLSRETSLATGTGDDFGMYRGVVDPRFQILAHDYDTILNQGDTTGGYQDSIFRMVQAVTGPIGYNLNATNLNRFFLHPEFAPIYYAHLKELCDTVFSPPQLGLTLDRSLQNFVPQNVINQMKTFGSNRVNYVLSQIPLTLTASATLSTNWGYLYTTEPVVTLFGRANAIDTRSVLVAGLPATWSALDARWTNTTSLQPGINRIPVESIAADGAVDRIFVEVWYDDGSTTAVAGSIATDTTWTPAEGPYVVSGTLTVNSGSTLTIEPGTSVYLASGANLTVASGGRLLAEGTDTARIRFSRVPGTGAWGGITISGDAGSPETRIAYAHIDGNNTTAIHSAGGTVFLDHLTFGNTNRQYLSLDDSSFVVSDCEFPRTSGTFEPVHGTGGIKAGGHGIFRRNYFGPTSGYNDVVDFTGGNRPGPILQFINNVFVGSGDDLLDLDGTDAWIEGNIFMHAHKNGSPDTASAVSGGDDSGATSEIIVIGNLIYDCDHAAMVKGGNFTTLINNTVVRQTKTGGIDTDAAVACLADEGFAQGAGMWIEGNILYDIEKLVRFYTNSAVTFTNNLMPLTWSGPGGGNSTNDPLLNYVPPVTATSNFTTWAQAQVMKQWFGLRPGSPAIGAGPNKANQGGAIPLGVSISGAPVGTNNQTSATLVVGVNRSGNGIPPAGWPNGSGFTHYKWRLDDGIWSAETAIATPISLTGLVNGPHYIEVSGKNDAGFYQDDPIFGADAVPTRTATWTVDTSYVPPAALTAVWLNEILAANQVAYPAGGEYPDVVELFNGSTLDANLAGVGLTDDPAVPYKFTFPAGTTLRAGGYLVVLMDNNTSTPGLHAGFNLSREGGRLALFAPPAGSGLLMDEVTFGPQITDRSIGRVTDGSWALNMPTLGTANIGAPTGDPRKLRINEWLASGQGILSDDFIELYNTDALPIDLGGFALTDNPIGWPDRFRIVPLSFIAPTNVLLYLADGQTNNGPEHLSFSLAAEQGIIALLDRQLAVIDEIVYGPQTTGISQGRIPNGADTLTFFSTPTPGSGNPAPATGCTVTTTTLALMPYTQVWRYNQTQDLSGLSWMAPNYNDGAWPTGPGLLAYETDGWISGLLGTTLADPRTAAPGLTTPRVYYFRTRFTVTTNLAGFEVTARMRVDDGVVVYLNGTELTRVRVGAGNITYSTLATTSTPGDAQTDETVTIPLDRLVAGTNVVAVVLLQNATTSSDSVWGMAIDAVRSQTNCIQAPVVLNEVFANNLSFTNADGTVSDWVELFNPSATPTTLSGMSLTDDTTDPRRWVFPAGVVLPPGGYLAVRCDGNMPASSNTVGILNTGFGLAANGDEIYLFDAGGALLDGITFGLQAPDYPIGRMPNGTGGWTIVGQTLGGQNLATATGNPALLRVNEWMADPRASDDWFEIFNPNPQPVAIGGCYLTDDLAERNKHRIPALSFIGTGLKGAYAVFFADNNPQNGADHVNFRLSGNGEALGLYSPAQEAIDIITFGAQLEGVSEGRLPDGVANLVAFPRSVSQGNANYLPIDSIVISEVLAHSDLPLEDAIEIQNVSRETVDMSGWWLTDARDDVYRFQIPSGTVLPPGGFAVFYEYQFNPTPGELPSFALSSSEGDEVYLVQTDSQGQLTGYRAVVSFGPSENGVSFGRYPTSVGEDFVAMSALSFGTTVTRNDPTNMITEFRTGQGATNSYPLVGPVVINEIMYNPRPDGTNDNTLDEYIELLNITAVPVPLFDPAAPTNTWHLRDGVDFDFPTNVTLPAGGFALVVNFDPATNVAQLATFRAKFNVGEGVPVFGPYSGKLDNGGEGINLRKPDMAGPDGNAPYVLVERIVFDDDAPWATLADGNTNELVGASLQRRVASEYGNDPVNWLAGLPTAGAPNGEALETLPAITTQPQGQNVPPGASPILTVVATGSPTLRYQWRKNGVDIAGETAASLTLNSVTAASAGIYTVRISNPAGAVLSASAEIAVQQPPEIARQPLSHLAVADSPTSFDVVARGSLPLSYQWRKEGVPVPGATEYRFTITNATLADQGNYSVVVTNLYGAVTSTVATLQVFTRPTIITQPQPTNLYIGGTISLNVAATGTDPLFYQWRLGNTPLPGQTNPVLTLNNAQVAQSGAYSVVVSNMIGTAVSDPVQVNVLVPPTLSVRATDPTATELGLTSGQFTLTRGGDPAPALSVNITITGTATPGSDCVAIAGPVLFDSGVTSAPVVVTPLDDATLESIETVVLTVNPGSIYVLGAPTTATVNVIDDDNQPPLVTLTNPPAGSLFHTPAIIPLGVVASDPDGTVTKVEYYDFETNKVATSTNAPFLATWTNAAPGVHQLTAVASDNFGATGASLPVEITVNASPTVLITSPLNGASFPLGENIAITVSATDLDGNVTQVEFWQGTNLLSTDASSPFGMLWSDVPVGSYSLTARATDDRGAVTISPAANITVRPPVIGLGDMFTNRGALFGFSNLITGNNLNFTREVGEPRHDLQQTNNGTHSAWLTWTAPASGVVTMETTDSDFDTVMAVYTNNPPAAQTLATLVKVISNDDADSSTLQSLVQFTATAGVTYQIAIDGYNNLAFGNIVFRLTQNNPYPVIITQPLSQTVNAGTDVAFNITATGPAPLSYRWLFNGTLVPDATTNSLQLASVQAANEGFYAAVVNNSAGAVTSTPALLTVRTPATIVSQPQTVVTEVGSNATFNATAAGNPPIRYQWAFNGTLLAGKTNASLTIADAQYTNGGTYTVTATNHYGTATSDAAKLILRPRFVGVERIPGGALLTHLGSPGIGYGLQGSTNFADWTTLREWTNSAVQQTTTDTNLPAGGRVYRLQVLP